MNRSSLHQLFRFSLVGIANTAVDFFVTNLLVLWTGAENSLSLMMISIVACLTATLNSFFLNRGWTFDRSQLSFSFVAMGRFYAIALIAMAMNTSIFLFSYRYLTEHFLFTKMVAINLSKLCAVSLTSLISFLGYKLYVFDKDKLDHFRRNFRFESDTSLSGWSLGMLLILTVTVRLLYLILAGVSLPMSEISLSFFPGVLLVIPVVIMACQLYGTHAAWLSGCLTASHPRMVEFSCNGLPESFYLLTYSLGAMGILLGVMDFRSRRWQLFLYSTGGLLVSIGSYLLLSKDIIGVMDGSTWHLPSAASYKDNIIYSLQRLPGVLITPTWLFALLLPLFYRSRSVSTAAYWPLLVMAFFPLLFYPFIHVEPRHFLSILIPIHIFGAAGVLAFVAYYQSRRQHSFVLPIIVGFLLVESLLVTVYRALWH